MTERRGAGTDRPAARAKGLADPDPAPPGPVAPGPSAPGPSAPDPSAPGPAVSPPDGVVPRLAETDGTGPEAVSGRPMRHPVTPDGRYFVVRGRLWRTANPALPEDARAALTRDLMAARRAVGAALRAGDDAALRTARAAVDRAKVALGERGPVWWSDGAPDMNRRMARKTPYAEWFAALPDAT